MIDKQDAIVSLLKEIDKNIENLVGSETDVLLSNRITTLENSVKTINTDINGIKTTNTTQTTNIASNTNKIDTANLNITNLTNELSTVKSNVSTNTSNIESLAGRVKTLETTGGSGGSGGGMIETTWAELKALRDNSLLVPGQLYRITDYVATTSDPESRSANHPFDIIVTADDNKTLNENARAALHEGDTYFEKCNLAAWKLKYCLDNDTKRFSWAQEYFDGYTVDFDGLLIKCELLSSNDTTYSDLPFKLLAQHDEFDGAIMYAYTSSLNSITPCNIDIEYEGEIVDQFEGIPLEFSYTQIDNGKGVIYSLTDEHDNLAPFDFKGIQIAVYYGIMRGSSNSEYTTDGKHDKFESLEFQRYSYLFTQNSDSNRADNSVEELYGFAKNNKFGCDEEGTLLHAVCCTKESPVQNCCNLLGNYWYADHLCYKFILFEENKGWTSNSDFIAEKEFVDVYNSGYNKYLGNCYSLNCMCDNSIMLGSIRGESESCLQIQASSSLVYQVDNTILTKKISDLLS